MISIKSIFQEIYKHKKVLIAANLVAILSTLLILPVPLLIPMLIDELILGQAGKVTQIIDHFMTVGSPEYYILRSCISK
jgi:ABC-type multidrug transport system fused ATPase/permease subunit